MWYIHDSLWLYSWEQLARFQTQVFPASPPDLAASSDLLSDLHIPWTNKINKQECNDLDLNQFHDKLLDSSPQSVICSGEDLVCSCQFFTKNVWPWQGFSYRILSTGSLFYLRTTSFSLFIVLAQPTAHCPHARHSSGRKCQNFQIK